MHNKKIRPCKDLYQKLYSHVTKAFICYKNTNLKICKANSAKSLIGCKSKNHLIEDKIEAKDKYENLIKEFKYGINNDIEFLESLATCSRKLSDTCQSAKTEPLCILSHEENLAEVEEVTEKQLIIKSKPLPTIKEISSS